MSSELKRKGIPHNTILSEKQSRVNRPGGARRPN
jgi:hypothetical protein